MPFLAATTINIFVCFSLQLDFVDLKIIPSPHSIVYFQCEIMLLGQKLFVLGIYNLFYACTFFLYQHMKSRFKI